MNKVIGQLCPACKAPMIQGPSGVYCKPCYIARKELNLVTSNSAQIIKEKTPDWDKINSKKSDNIKWLNALNNAGSAFANGKIDKDRIEEFANWFYGLEPESKKQPF